MGWGIPQLTNIIICRIPYQAFYNPGSNGGIERTGRAPDVTAPTARYPFEVGTVIIHHAGMPRLLRTSTK